VPSFDHQPVRRQALSRGPSVALDDRQPALDDVTVGYTVLPLPGLAIAKTDLVTAAAVIFW
jgi:hypothetical protein